MIEKIIENTTPYLGKMILKFEKYPHYTSSQDGKLNKVHINLGFTKLVSRMKPKQVMEGYSNIDPKKIELIEKYTGGVIGTHKWGDDDEYDFDQEWLFNDGVSSVIPFNKRGKDTVKNWMDARIAATNLSKYLG